MTLTKSDFFPSITEYTVVHILQLATQTIYEIVTYYAFSSGACMKTFIKNFPRKVPKCDLLLHELRSDT